MSRKSTAELLQKELDKKKELEKQIRELQKKQREEERIKRDKRHTERGAIAERLLDGKAELTDKEFQKKIEELLKGSNRQNRPIKTTDTPADETATDKADES